MRARNQIDETMTRALRKAIAGVSPVYTTIDSIHDGEKIMEQARVDATANIAERIRRGEYLTLGQLQSAWQVKRAVINNALTAGRIFAVVGPSGEKYYPSFFADPSLDRRVLEKIAKALGSLPAAAKYHFFTSKFTALGESPLDALRKGKVEQVIFAATGYAER